MKKRTPLAVYRYSAGYTQQELADRVGVSREAIVAIENGQHKPRQLTARALGAALDVDPSTLFPEETAQAVGQ